ncbi:MAG TPA: alpha/beta hydrolase [Vicinamibacterales bacterium]|nr:alpha/beta hydrolase [Vicinamibacterales bacterium]
MRGIVDIGRGTPIVLIPGLQGRWEWMRPTVDALAKHHRVITFSLCDERTSPFPCDPAKGFDNFLEQVDLALDRSGIAKAVIVGVSYGGLIASEFAARRPQRVTALVLASALHKTWQPDRFQQRYLTAPRLMSPLFVVTAPSRLQPEISAAIPELRARLRFIAWHTVRTVLSPTTPTRMARRIAWLRSHQFANPHSVKAPALVVTGEPVLDRVLPVAVTRRYLDDIDSVGHVVMKHTGHLGFVTQPAEFARVVQSFVENHGFRLSA